MTTNLRSGRGHGKAGWLSPRDRLRWGNAIRAELAANPFLLIEELVKRTGAPPELARQVKAKWKQRQEQAA